MPTITYMSIEQAEEEITDRRREVVRQNRIMERIRRFATPDLDVAKKREAEGWGKEVNGKC